MINYLFQMSDFLKPLDTVPRSRRGWYFGAQLTGRPSLVQNNTTPAPAEYQTVQVGHTGAENKAAFNRLSPRWQERAGDHLEPGLVPSF